MVTQKTALAALTSTGHLNTLGKWEIFSHHYFLRISKSSGLLPKSEILSPPPDPVTKRVAMKSVCKATGTHESRIRNTSVLDLSGPLQACFNTLGINLMHHSGFSKKPSTLCPNGAIRMITCYR